jgi:hypothetical protein
MVSVCATPHDPGHEDRLFVLAAALVDGLRDYADLDGEDLRNRICEEMTHSL